MGSDRMQISKGPTPSCLFLPTVMLLLASSRWTILTKKLKYRRNYPREKQQAGNRGRSELLGSDHKQARSDIRSQLQEGYYISHSGKKAIRVVHCLGRCYMLPGVDYLSFSYAGVQFPASDEYDTVCKWCARASESKADPGSSGTNTSSSSDE